MAKRVTEPAKARLNEVAMLVDMTIHRWTPMVTDRAAGKEVAQQHQAEVAMGRFVKNLLNPKAPAIQKLVRLTNELRQAHTFRTLPWIDGGTRILSSKGYFAYTKAVSELVAQYKVASEEFIAGYEEAVKDARRRLGTLFVEGEYPSKDQLRHRFGVTLNFFPLPAREDFRVDLGNEETERIRKSIQETAQSQIDAAMKDVWGRLSAVLGKAVEKLNGYKRNSEGRIENGFRDTLITNITELLEMIPSLNITGDTKLTEFAEEIRKQITVYSADALRDNESLRPTVAKKAEEILSKMNGYLA